MPAKSNFDQMVAMRYHIYNSLLLNLPFKKIYRTGTLLPLLHQYVEEGFEKGQAPKEIIESFFQDYVPSASEKERFDLLFSFIQYAERQVVLFDSIEDAAFDKINDVNGRGTLTAFFSRINSKEGLAALRNKLEDFSLRIVLTAHPTQFYPGNVLAIINDLEHAIKEDHLPHINLLLQQLGKTPFLNREKPTPFDEALSLSWYLENVFYEAVPAILIRLFDELNQDPLEWKNYDLIRIGFWPGGDRDGNPFVTHETTQQVSERLRQSILRKYYRDVRILRRRLTFRGVSEIIYSIELRLNETHAEHKAYESAEELIADLVKARKVLIEKHDGLFLNLLDAVLIKVKLFGFFFSSMDIRQDSTTHGKVMEDVLKSSGNAAMSALPEKEQIESLVSLKLKIEDLQFSDLATVETIKTIQSTQSIQKVNGEAGCHRYIISNSGSALDVIRIFCLTRWVWNQPENLPIDVVPLFETIGDLASAEKVMKVLYENPIYRAHLKSRSNKQTIMLGFSDGTKDGGYLRANWSIYQAKEALTTISRQYGVTALFFDGRGGPPARGGGNTHDFYASLGDTIENAEVQITIQGQTISSNFGKPVSCQYNLEQMLSAGLESSVFGHQSTRLAESEKQLIEKLAQTSFEAYMVLRRHPQFVPYLENATPLRYFGETNIASRPTKRNAGSLKFEDLRAIPFVGSWAQMKQNIPGFYGFGSALSKWKDEEKSFRALYDKSLFFRTLVHNSMMALTKTNYPATQYLASDPDFSDLWGMMFEEYNKSLKNLLAISGQKSMLESNPTNRDSIALREKIVSPLIAIQQYALQEKRNQDGGQKPKEYFDQLILRCMFGIINAARNSA